MLKIDLLEMKYIKPVHHPLLLYCPLLPFLILVYSSFKTSWFSSSCSTSSACIMYYILVLILSLLLFFFFFFLIFSLSFMCSTERRLTIPSHPDRRNRTLPRLHSIPQCAWRPCRRSLPSVPCPSRRLHLHTGQQHESLG